MYRHYAARATGSSGSSSSSNNNTALNPPWAVSNVAVPGSRSPRAASNANGHSSSRGSGGHHDNRPNSKPTPEVANTNRERPRQPVAWTIHWYGGRTTISPYDRDLPFYLNIFNQRVPSRGSASSRDRERRRRDANIVEERRVENEARSRRVVPPEVPKKKNVLTVEAYDLNLASNTKAHHTDLYECTEREVDPQLVVRRGKPFALTFAFQRPWDIEHDDMMIEFELGRNPSLENGSLHQLALDEFSSDKPNDPEGWAAKLLERRGNQITVAVFIPANAIVGMWRCGVTTSLVGSSEKFVFEGLGHIYVLFNPWCQDDQVFFNDDPQLLDEYILNEYGCLFEGEADYISRRPWYYGQFDDGILDTCLTILRLAFDMDINRDMGNAVTVARKLSRVLNNSNKDPGIMTGNWSGNFTGGTAPFDWQGSVRILRQFERTRKPVNYVQCFVFSHVFTTVLRALGIPSRSLTNFESAHDTDKSGTIDSYMDDNGNDLPHLKSDSIWNFHCWNDVWINRPDLDLTSSSRDRYSGWHAVDCTPQEKSEDRFQCGPTPLKAVKHGEVGVGHDTKFIFGEVNGEVVKWMVPSDRSRDLRVMERKPAAVGKKISTKFPDGKPARGTFNPGSRKVHEVRMDITDLYKYPEGSEEERQCLKVALGESFGARVFQNAAGITIEIGQIHNLSLGSNFEFKAILSNTSSDEKEAEVIMGVYPTNYRGERLGWSTIAHQKIEGITMKPNTREVFSLKVVEKFYMEQCDPSMSMMLRAFAKVKGEEKPLNELKKVVLAKPELEVKPLTPASRLVREQPFTVSILVTNPSSKPMTSCRLVLEGNIEPLPSQGFTQEDGAYFKKIKDIFPNEVRNITMEVMGRKRPLNNGVRELEVEITSTESPPLTGSLDVQLA